jgi:hypothetical protein
MLCKDAGVVETIMEELINNGMDFETDVAAASVKVTFRLYDPLVAGVPVIVPVAGASVRPAGRLVTAQVYPPLPPVPVNVSV